MRTFVVLLTVLAFAAPAAAATPRFALFDLESDLAPISRNPFGDIQVKPRVAIDGQGTLVRCATRCRFGNGWLAFRADPHLRIGDVTAATSGYSRKKGWTVQLTLRPAAVGRWTAFAKQMAADAKKRGVPDVLVVVAGGQISGALYSTQISAAHGQLTLAGLSRASATAVVKTLR